MNEHLFQLLLVALGVIAGAIPASLRNWRKDRDAEVTRNLTLANETKERGKLEQRIEKLEKDLNGVARGMSERMGKYERKNAALEVKVTGQLPRVSGESEAVRSAQS